MTKALYVATPFLMVVEEEIEVVCLRIKQACEEDIDKVGDAFGQLGRSPHAVEIGVRFENV